MEIYFGKRRADHSGPAVEGMKCLRSRKHWVCGFETHSNNGYVCFRSVFVLFCVESGLAKGWSPVQGALSAVCNIQVSELILTRGTGQKAESFNDEEKTYFTWNTIFLRFASCCIYYNYYVQIFTSTQQLFYFILSAYIKHYMSRPQRFILNCCRFLYTIIKL
jgi:hypothetical protein